jgi:archaellum component FlaD/FlaE
MTVICGNIQNLFLQYNKLDDSNNISCEDFIVNQYFIHKLSDEKYKKEILKHIIEEVRINNV